MTRGAVHLDVLIERKQAGLPAFVVVPAARLAAWKLAGTTTIEGTLDGAPLGRRSLKRWDEARWFIELRKELLAEIGKAPGERATLAITRASTELPAELAALIEADPAVAAAWKAASDAQRRMLREEIHGLKSPAARTRRARLALLPEPKAPARPVAGLSAAPREVTVRIIGRRLPGRSCGGYGEVAVCLARKTGCVPAEFVSGGAREASWETRVEVREKDGAPAFRGPDVNGPPTERFLYLTWIGRQDGAAPAMFRRAKLRLDAVPPAVLAKAVRSGLLVGRVDLTDACGMPLCASVRPPVIAWAEA